jgi:hypothetical protein
MINIGISGRLEIKNLRKKRFSTKNQQFASIFMAWEIDW